MYSRLLVWFYLISNRSFLISLDHETGILPFIYDIWRSESILWCLFDVFPLPRYTMT